MENLLLFIFLVFGLIIGSFLNVVICRYNAKSLGGRSACMTCSNTLSWYELIPVFSFLFLRGRCRHCKSKISAQYPLVELASGIIFASLFYKFQTLFFADTFAFTVTYAYYVLMFSLLLVVAVYDLKHKIIPDIFSLVFGVLAFAGIFFFDGTWSPHAPHTLDVLAGFLAALPFALFWLVSMGRWMGLGDAKLALGLGWLLGVWKALSGIILAFWIGAAVGILLIIFSKNHKLKSEIPFAPFLVLGAFLAFMFDLHFLFVF